MRAEMANGRWQMVSLLCQADSRTERGQPVRVFLCPRSPNKGTYTRAADAPGASKLNAIELPPCCRTYEIIGRVRA